MAHIFREIDGDNIDRLSDLFEIYSGTPLHKEGILRSGQTLPTWSVWDAGEPVGFYYTLRFTQDILKLVHIFVPHSARRQGVGTAMLTQLFEIMPQPFTGVIAANSMLYQTRETKVDPEPFYARNGFATIANTNETKVFWKLKS
jgi:GNAT superfamily N-acetyltransferase